MDKKMDLALEKQRLRFNKEKETWTFGIMMWLICFEAILVLSVIYSNFSYAGLLVGIILIFVVVFQRKNLRKEIKEAEEKVREIENGK